MDDKKKSVLIDKSQVGLFFISGNNPNLKDSYYYDKTYEHWKSIWGEHFKERDGIKKLFSDNFTRQDEITALFWNGECISTCCNRAIDLNRPAFWDDSYFEVWDHETIEKLKRDGPQVAICSQFTVIPGSPIFTDGVKVREVMVYLTATYLRHCGFDAFTGTARKDKGMQNSFGSLGAETIKSDLKFHGGTVDLMAFYRDGKVSVDPKIASVSTYLWNKRKMNEPILTLKSEFNKNLKKVS